LKTALKIGADYIALSFVRNSADITEVKALIKEAGSCTSHCKNRALRGS
jgi:pyruvate kinase